MGSVIVFALLALVVGSVYFLKQGSSKKPKIVGGPDAELVHALVTAEETYLKLTPLLNRLGKGMMLRQLPSEESAAVFSSSARVVDLGVAPAVAVPKVAPDVWRVENWGVESSARSRGSAGLWRTLLDLVEAFDHADFKIVDGDHPDGDPYRFESRLQFQGLARMRSGEWRSLSGRVGVSWVRAETAVGQPAAAWQIVEWRTEGLEFYASPRRLFVEVLDRAMKTPEAAAGLRRSPHYEATVKHYRSGMKSPPHPYFAPISANQKDGLAVADVDGDGFDDIYVTMRLGNNIFLHNNGDGTFTDESTRRGLALPGHTTCALFADFDNDGDLDLMLGRSLLRTAYLENRGGLFFQRPSPKHFPMAVISMAAADYNKDGLLDVYLCTYRPAASAGSSPSGGVANIEDGGFDWPDEFLSPEQAKEFRKKVAEQRQNQTPDNAFPGLFDQLGPPNVLLINRGKGWFEVAPESEVVGVWRNSLQATWGDYDQDGDPDLYIANDWAPDEFFRNDGAAGFRDISKEVGMIYYGFAMGASWGDYDNDGLEDLYVSNMYSDPGKRITGRIPGLDKMFVESASGNWLYHHQPGGKFRQVAGLKEPAMKVMNAGWSWGGCFADFNNDGFLDLYVLSGYFSAPEELASGMDLESNLWRTTVRSDANLARNSFRFSPEWKRTMHPDMQGPEIDSRLGGVDRQGDRTVVHSLNGHERNRYFANLGGKQFADLSALSGLDNPADSRGFALLDFDRDGWQDVALVNANQPLFNLYRNEMAAAGMKGGLVALRFVGGNKTPGPQGEWSNRDGIGARVKVVAGGQNLIREQRCGDGWSVQNSATMLVGIGSAQQVDSLTVRWPSGKASGFKSIPEGTLLTIYENPVDSPQGQGFKAEEYRVSPRRR